MLSLLPAKGTCARGSRAVSINQRGPVGATGKSGPQGRRGAAAPTPISIALDTTGATSSSKALAVGSTGMTVQGTCEPSSDGATLSELVLNGGSDYYVHGAAQDLPSSGSDFGTQTVLPGGTQAVPSGASLIAYESVASSTIEVYGPSSDTKTSGNTQLYADLIVLAGSQSFSIHLYEFLTSRRCQLSAQVIAS